MNKYCLRTKVIGGDNIYLYYTGMEDEKNLPYALNVIVNTSIDKATEFDEDEAIKLCNRLNKDKEALLKCEFTEFEVINKANSD